MSSLTLWFIGLPPFLIVGCARSTFLTAQRADNEPVIVYPARLLSEHPLYAQVQTLSARIAALEMPEDLREPRALLSSPLTSGLLAPPRAQPPSLGSFTRWEADADAALAARVQQAEQSLGSWPHLALTRAQASAEQHRAEVLQDAENEAAIARLRAELAAIQRRQNELEQLRQLAQSEDEVQAAKAVARQVALWREINGEIEAARREAEARLRELRERVDAEAARAVAEAREKSEAERVAYSRDLEAAGQMVRERQPAAVRRAMQATKPADNARTVAQAPDVADLTALLRQIEIAQRRARERRLGRLVAARGRLLREIALSTESAVQAAALRSGLDVRFAPDPHRRLRDATEEFRPLLRDYWARVPPLADKTLALER